MLIGRKIPFVSKCFSLPSAFPSCLRRLSDLLTMSTKSLSTRSGLTEIREQSYLESHFSTAALAPSTEAEPHLLPIIKQARSWPKKRDLETTLQSVAFSVKTSQTLLLRVNAPLLLTRAPCSSLPCSYRLVNLLAHRKSHCDVTSDQCPIVLQRTLCLVSPHSAHKPRDYSRLNKHKFLCTCKTHIYYQTVSPGCGRRSVNLQLPLDPILN